MTAQPLRCRACGVPVDVPLATVRLVPTPTVLAVGTEGRYQGARFVLAGHVRVSNQDGAAWDEFALAFEGRQGWLACAQGALLLTFEYPLRHRVPSFAALKVNEVLAVPGAGDLDVVEKGTATVEAVSGEVPGPPRPGDRYPFADLASWDGGFATLDYRSNRPTLYVGRQVTFEEVGMARPQTVLPAPAPTPTPTCPGCGAALEPPCRPVVPIGSSARFAAGPMTLLGYLRKSTTDAEGTTYYWDEYLFRGGDGVYHWLSQSDGHWTLLDPIAGSSEVWPALDYQDRRYPLFQQGGARVVHAEGEFYWRVRVGDVSHTADYVCPPYLLAAEFTEDGPDKGEAAWTHGVYLDVAEVEKALGVQGLPRPVWVGANQPFVHGEGLYRWWGLAVLVLLAVGTLFIGTASPRVVFEKTFTLKPPADDQLDKVREEVDDGGKKLVEHQVLPDEKDDTLTVSLKGRQNIHARATVSGLDNSWVDVVGSLIDDETGDAQPFEIALEYYSGVEDGNPWTEDLSTDDVYVSSLPAGEYVLRLDVYRESPSRTPIDITLTIEQDVRRFKYLVWALLAVSLLPLVVGVAQLVFEGRRWGQSDTRPTRA